MMTRPKEITDGPQSIDDPRRFPTVLSPLMTIPHPNPGDIPPSPIHWYPEPHEITHRPQSADNPASRRYYEPTVPSPLITRTAISILQSTVAAKGDTSVANADTDKQMKNTHLALKISDSVPAGICDTK